MLVPSRNRDLMVGTLREHTTSTIALLFLLGYKHGGTGRVSFNLLFFTVLLVSSGDTVPLSTTHSCAKDLAQDVVAHLVGWRLIGIVVPRGGEPEAHAIGNNAPSPLFECSFHSTYGCGFRAVSPSHLPLSDLLHLVLPSLFLRRILFPSTFLIDTIHPGVPQG